MDKRKILIQLDTDPHAERLRPRRRHRRRRRRAFSYGGVKPEQVRRPGPRRHLHARAQGPEAHGPLHRRQRRRAPARSCWPKRAKHMLPQFGLRVSVLLDANGANTTAAAAVRAAARASDSAADAGRLVLGGTGPVGQRVARLLRAKGPMSASAPGRRPGRRPSARRSSRTSPMRSSHRSVVSERCGAGGGLEGADARDRRRGGGRRLVAEVGPAAAKSLKVAIDLNAVPPLGIEGVEVEDKGVEHDGVVCYGAIGVGDTKMKMHRAAVASLFESNDQVLDAEEIYAIAQIVLNNRDERRGLSPPASSRRSLQLTRFAATGPAGTSPAARRINRCSHSPIGPW